MRHDTDSTEIARRVADVTLAGVAEAKAFVVISSIDLELAKSKRKHPMLSRRQLSSHLSALPSAQTICDAWRSGGPAVARAVALASTSEPQSVWWCDTREEYERALSGIYERLRRSPRPHDAYDHGSCDSLVWITLWRD